MSTDEKSKPPMRCTDCGAAAALPKQNNAAKHHKALPWRQLPALYAALARRDGAAARGLRFLIPTAARTGEVRGAEWAEINVAEAIWTVPAARMKTRMAHRAPLAEAALAHTLGDQAERAYARSDLFDRRRTLMADWAAFVTQAPETAR